MSVSRSDFQFRLSDVRLAVTPNGGTGGIIGSVLVLQLSQYCVSYKRPLNTGIFHWVHARSLHFYFMRLKKSIIMELFF